MTRQHAAPPSREVRRCAACGQATLRVVHAWQHRLAAFDTPARTLELACSTCGAEVVLHPQTTIRAETILAVLLMPAVIPGVFFLLRARRKARAWTDNPVVDGAASLAPARPGPPQRRCACLSSADCVAIVRKGSWNVPIGRRYDYLCARCERRFQVHDVAGVVFAGVLATMLTGAGVLVALHPPGAAVGAADGNRWFGLGLIGASALAWVLFAARARGRLRHPTAQGTPNA